MMRYKNILWLLIGALFFAACASDESDNYGRLTPHDISDNQQVSSLELSMFKVKISSDDKHDVTSSSIRVNFKPTTDNIDYLPVLFERDSLMVPELDVNKLLERTLKAYADSQHVSVEQYVSDNKKRGEQQIRFDHLKKETVYAVLVYQLDGSGKIQKQCQEEVALFKTNQVEVEDLNFDISHKERDDAFDVKVVPENRDKGYWVLVMMDAQRIILNDMYNQKDEDIFLANVRSMLSKARKKAQALGENPDNKTLLKAMLHKGNVVLPQTDLVPNLDYVVMVAGVTMSEDDKTPLLNTNIKFYSFTTPKKETELPTVNFYNEVSEGATPGKVRVKRGNDDSNVEYCWAIKAFDHNTRYMSDIELANALLEEYMNEDVMYHGVVPPWQRKRRTYDREYSNPEQGVPCYSIIFALNKEHNEVASKPIVVRFKYGVKQGMDDVTYTASKLQDGAYGLKINITPSKKNISFAYELKKAGTFSPEAAKTAFTNKMQDEYADWKWQQKGMGNSMVDYVESKYKRDKFEGFVIDLDPGVTYDLFIYTIDPETGNIIKTDVKRNFASTQQLDLNATIDYDVYGVFDGDEINETVVDPHAVDGSLTRGRALLVIRYNLERVKEGWAYVMPETNSKIELNPKLVTDRYILKKVGLDANKIERRSVYRKYYCNWDDPLVIMTMGINNNNALGSIKRKELLTPKKSQKTDIRKLTEIQTHLIDFPDFIFGG